MRYIGIDLSTKTGLVILDKFGQVLKAEEVTSNKEEEIERMIDITDKVIAEIKDNDLICVEGFSYGSKGRGIGFQFGIGYILRYKLYDRDMNYLIATPSQLKKYASGKGNTSKDNLILPIYKRWSFEHDSDNVRDAFVLSQIARSYERNDDTTKFQEEVLKSLEYVKKEV